MFKQSMKLSVSATYRAPLTNSGLYMKRLTAWMDMSAWKSALIWRMTPIGTIEEARRLWAVLNRSERFNQSPATYDGLHAYPATHQRGINVNVTLLFGCSLPTGCGSLHCWSRARAAQGSQSNI